MVWGMSHDHCLGVVCSYNRSGLDTDWKAIASPWGPGCVINLTPLLFSWVSISSMMVDQAASPLPSAALRRSSRCWRQSAWAFVENSESFLCVISIWIIMLMKETLLGPKRWERKQSCIKLWGSGVLNPVMYILTRARSQRRANQKPTLRLYSMWQDLSLVQFTLECNMNSTRSLSQFFTRDIKSASEKELRLE